MPIKRPLGLPYQIAQPSLLTHLHSLVSASDLQKHILPGNPSGCTGLRAQVVFTILSSITTGIPINRMDNGNVVNLHNGMLFSC